MYLNPHKTHNYQMESPILSNFAEKLVQMVNYRGLCEWKVKQELKKGDDFNADVMDRNVEAMDNTTRKINAFMDYIKSRHCSWEEFSSSYGRKKDVTLPGQDSIAQARERIHARKEKAKAEKYKKQQEEKAKAMGYSNDDLKKPTKNVEDVD